MRTLRRLAFVVLLAVASVPVVHADAVTSTSSVESRILSLVNQGRSGRRLPGLRSHGGLTRVARGHSGDMARAGRLTHANFARRVNKADPKFRQGGAACENVGMYRPAQGKEGDAAKVLVDGWTKSRTHRDCMYDARRMGYNVAGIGVHRDGRGAWWATLEVVRSA